MALIYANAVSKRMNQPPRSRKESMMRDEYGRKSSTCREPISKTSGSVIFDEANAQNGHPVPRNKTSCCELGEKKRKEAPIRKSSHPPLPLSVTTPDLDKCARGGSKKSQKKNVIQRYDLEQRLPDAKPPAAAALRRKSVSLDAEGWDERFGNDTVDSTPIRKCSTFQKVKKMFQEFKLG